jgi:PAB1-binding protein PBP1
MLLGGVGTALGAIGWASPSPSQYLPGVPKKFIIEPSPEPAKLGGVVGAVSGGLIIGGFVAKGIAWLIRSFL